MRCFRWEISLSCSRSTFAVSASSASAWRNTSRRSSRRRFRSSPTARTRSTPRLPPSPSGSPIAPAIHCAAFSESRILPGSTSTSPSGYPGNRSKTGGISSAAARVRSSTISSDFLRPVSKSEITARVRGLPTTVLSESSAAVSLNAARRAFTAPATRAVRASDHSRQSVVMTTHHSRLLRIGHVRGRSTTVVFILRSKTTLTGESA